MSALSQKTLQAILKNKVQPIPLWKVRFKYALYWVGVWVFGVLAILATALTWHILFEIDWDAYEKAHFSWIERIQSGVPFLSLFLLSLFLIGSVVFLRYTKRGYRYQRAFLFIFFMMTSAALGYVFEESPADEQTERFFMQRLPHSKEFQILPSAEQQWSQPEKGLLGGSVISPTQEGSMQVLDGAQKRWDVDTSQAVDVRVPEDNQEDVKIIGNQKDEHTFEAEEIRSWKNRTQEGDKKDEHKESEKERETDDD